MGKKIFLVCGRSCAGKSSIVRELCERHGLCQVKSYTTRPARPGEEKISDHIFITENDIPAYAKGVVAYTYINGNHYFATVDCLEKADFYVIDPNGIELLKDTCGDSFDLVTVYIHTDLETAAVRSGCRGDDAFMCRYESEKSQFDRFEDIHGWDYYLENNGTFYDAVEQFERILKKEGVID